MNLLDLFSGKNVYLVSDNDLDGISCRVIFEYFLKNNLNLYYITNTSDRKMSEFNYNYSKNSDYIIFSDITPTIELYNDLISQGKEVYIFDHHKSAYDELNNIVPNDHYFYTTEKCGCKILFDALTYNKRFKKCVYQYVELVDIADRFVEESGLWKQSRDLHNIMFGYVNWRSNQDDTHKYLSYIQAQLDKFYSSKRFYFNDYEIDLAIKAEKKERENLLMARKSLSIRQDNSGNKYAYFELNSKGSYVANVLLKEYDNIEYCIFNSIYEENSKVSLRSKNGFDVSTIAVIHGGGGHSAAAGVELPQEVFDKLKTGEGHLI